MADEKKMIKADDSEKETKPAADSAKEKKEKKPAKLSESGEKETVSDDEDLEDDGEVDTDELFKRRKSIDMTPENARFFRSKGGMVSLEIDGEEGRETFERVVVLRSFPITAPNEFLSVREPDSRKKGRGAEIGMIRYLSDFDKDTVALINEELDLRYFTPVITKINSIKDKFGYSYWDVETTAGKISLVLNNPYGNVRVLEDKRIFISDMDGNSFIIPDPTALDRASYRRIEVYI